VALQIEEEPALLLDPKMCDSIAKITKAMERIDNREQYLGAVHDLIKVANAWLAEHQPALKAELDPYWDSIFQELKAYATGKGQV
jgi:hypothetical protein